VYILPRNTAATKFRPMANFSRFNMNLGDSPEGSVAALLLPSWE
jgi:hypothetical protein